MWPQAKECLPGMIRLGTICMSVRVMWRQGRGCHAVRIAAMLEARLSSRSRLKPAQVRQRQPIGFAPKSPPSPDCGSRKGLLVRISLRCSHCGCPISRIAATPGTGVTRPDHRTGSADSGGPGLPVIGDLAVVSGSCAQPGW